MLTAVKEQFEEERTPELAANEALNTDGRLPVIFVIMQTGNRANGGVESITQVLERLRRVRPIVVTQRETAASKRWRSDGFEVLVWAMARPALRIRSVLRANLRMFRLIRSTGCRIVHCNDISALWNTAFGARLAGAAVVFNIRNIKPDGQRYGWRWRVARRVSSRQLVLSKEMQAALAARLGLKNGKGQRQGLEHIYSTVDSVCFSPIGQQRRAELRQRLGIDASCFAIGYVGAFEPRKAQLNFIKEAGPRLKLSLPQAKTYFTGDFTPERNDYARQCLEALKGLGLEQSVSFVGYTSEMADWYRALDVVVVASRNEGLARCMIEGLACGTPAVSFDVCSAREILEEHGCGVVVPQGDYPSLVDRLAYLAVQNSMRQEMGQLGATMARELFDPELTVRRYEHLYFSLAGA